MVDMDPKILENATPGLIGVGLSERNIPASTNINSHSVIFYF